MALSNIAGASTVWIEAESIADQVPNASRNAASPDLLSGEEVLSLNFNRRDVEAKVPEEGLSFSYPFEVSEAGEYSFWKRVVFEKIRAPFQWRVNGGEWIENDQSTHPIINVQELAFWNPIGWTEMGSVNLASGSHQLEINAEPPL